MESSDKQFLIYESDSGAIEVQLGQDTVWLSQAQLAELFGTQRPAITKHIGNIFNSNELDKDSVCSILEHTASDGKRYKTLHYNLDVIISVGYRVNSLNATRFRQWATARLKEHLVQGYTLNSQRFEANAKELEAAMALLRKTAQSPTLQIEASRGLIDIATRYAQTFLLLQRYSAAFLFVDFLNRNDRLLDDAGQPVINDVGLAALTLLVAESDPAQKETLIRLMMNMLAKEIRD
ncbi:MAG: virulence RhuM family protein [Candidatus Thiodiazotropha taylori]|nr:virulence RhuM family protein [Candidatus Thiodiazotropha taylori]MCG8092602.1 virulence RhuM family protein [Candidatus Thiodiazotropha endolucinida]MCG8109523.1 virulence RhuM family protein [Candidatus Thiodiazotropha taylori]MCW4281864.1 virulence RhuM family protein [Candidatus Thiodiazotropha taylori]MCW4305942.1 virulence RhuM family protein [Candidatus Thiodiazotropha taylori]